MPGAFCLNAGLRGTMTVQFACLPSPMLQSKALAAEDMRWRWGLRTANEWFSDQNEPHVFFILGKCPPNLQIARLVPFYCCDPDFVFTVSMKTKSSHIDLCRYSLICTCILKYVSRPEPGHHHRTTTRCDGGRPGCAERGCGHGTGNESNL